MIFHEQNIALDIGAGGWSASNTVEYNIYSFLQAHHSEEKIDCVVIRFSTKLIIYETFFNFMKLILL